MITNKYHLLITETTNFSKEAAELLNKHFDTKYANINAKQIAFEIADYEILWVRLGSYIDKNILDRADKLKIIVTATTGLNHIDVKYAAKKGIKVISLKGESKFLRSIRATAELTIGLILSIMRNIPQSIGDVKNKNWNREQFKGYELYQKKVGIIGYGRLGKIVSKYLHHMGTYISIYDPHIKEKLPKYAKSCSLSDIFKFSDIVSIHASHTPETKKMINDKVLSNIKKPIFFVNTARGEIVDEESLLKNLECGNILAAALDVLNQEENGVINNKLIDYSKTHQNLIITPHIGGCCYESMSKTEVFMAHKLLKTVLII